MYQRTVCSPRPIATESLLGMFEQLEASRQQQQETHKDQLFELLEERFLRCPRDRGCRSIAAGASAEARRFELPSHDLKRRRTKARRRGYGWQDLQAAPQAPAPGAFRVATAAWYAVVAWRFPHGTLGTPPRRG